MDRRVSSAATPGRPSASPETRQHQWFVSVAYGGNVYVMIEVER
jgi:hypothetical protein